MSASWIEELRFLFENTRTHRVELDPELAAALDAVEDTPGDRHHVMAAILRVGATYAGTARTLVEAAAERHEQRRAVDDGCWRLLHADARRLARALRLPEDAGACLRQAFEATQSSCNLVGHACRWMKDGPADIDEEPDGPFGNWGPHAGAAWSAAWSAMWRYGEGARNEGWFKAWAEMRDAIVRAMRAKAAEEKG